MAGLFLLPFHGREGRAAVFGRALGVAALVSFLAVAAGLRAADGQIDLVLNPAGTTTISTPGSYVLVENVTMAAGVDCIAVSPGVNDVIIDFNGHTIAGGGAAAA